MLPFDECVPGSSAYGASRAVRGRSAPAPTQHKMWPADRTAQHIASQSSSGGDRSGESAGAFSLRVVPTSRQGPPTQPVRPVPKRRGNFWGRPTCPRHHPALQLHTQFQLLSARVPVQTLTEHGLNHECRWTTLSKTKDFRNSVHWSRGVILRQALAPGPPSFKQMRAARFRSTKRPGAIAGPWRLWGVLAHSSALSGAGPQSASQPQPPESPSQPQPPESPSQPQP